jgi:hypothetical protein
MTTITATTRARELLADELDQIAGGRATSTGCASSTKYPEVTLVISDITVGGVPTG